jgi:hypothetical protein
VYTIASFGWLLADKLFFHGLFVKEFAGGVKSREVSVVGGGP